jgi:hypothetical protein
MKQEWIYKNNKDNTCRYVLGKEGDNPLICFGVNPSTAEPGKLDNTMRNVEHFAFRNGFDSFIMLNLYPQRATKPDYMHSLCLKEEYEKGIRFIEEILKEKQRVIWAAWGTLIEKRSYLFDAIKEIYLLSEKYDAVWVSLGKHSVQGHPHHPLYLKKDLKFEKFEMNKYISKLYSIKRNEYFMPNQSRALANMLSYEIVALKNELIKVEDFSALREDITINNIKYYEDLSERAKSVYIVLESLRCSNKN